MTPSWTTPRPELYPKIGLLYGHSVFLDTPKEMSILCNVMLHIPNQQFRKIKFYLRGLSEHFLIPDIYYRHRLAGKLAQLNKANQEEVLRRVNYYHKIERPFEIPDNALPISEVSRKKTTYLFDLRRIMRYFPSDCWVSSRFGDITDVTNYPRLVKTRPLTKPNANNILLRFNSIRHFRPIRDPLTFRQKTDSLVWRGKVKHDHRVAVFHKHFDHPFCDIGKTGPLKNNDLDRWQKPFMSIQDQLQHKFILSIEGNDVATNLKWIAQSNSLCFMTRPKFESWFMEGTLRAGQHYVELKDDYSDLPEKMDHYLTHPEEAEAIIHNLQRYYDGFRCFHRETLIGLLVAQKYLKLSGQLED